MTVFILFLLFPILILINDNNIKLLFKNVIFFKKEKLLLQ